MNLKRHPLRQLSNVLHMIAMLPFVPLALARKISALSSRLYYTR